MHKQGELITQRTAVDDRRLFRKSANEIEAADAAPRPVFERGREIEQESRRLDMRRERTADAFEIDAIGLFGQGFCSGRRHKWAY
jgi:hypothetical protein